MRCGQLAKPNAEGERCRRSPPARGMRSAPRAVLAIREERETAGTLGGEAEREILQRLVGDPLVVAAAERAGFAAVRHDVASSARPPSGWLGIRLDKFVNRKLQSKPTRLMASAADVAENPQRIRRSSDVRSSARFPRSWPRATAQFHRRNNTQWTYVAVNMPHRCAAQSTANNQPAPFGNQIDSGFR